MARWTAVIAVVLTSLLSACLEPTSSDCLDACEAENACPGADQEPCRDLCQAIPKDCVMEHEAYWGCAAANLDQACNAYTACGDELVDLSACVTAYCLLNPFSPDCYY